MIFHFKKIITNYEYDFIYQLDNIKLSKKEKSIVRII